MTPEYPILRSLDPHHQRIGYLGALATVAHRGADRRDSLERRFRSMLFRRIEPDDPGYAQLLEHLTDDGRAELERRMRKRADLDPAAILKGPGQRQGWLCLNDFWILDRCMPSALGDLSERKVHRTVDLAKWTAVLLPSYELSEAGFILQQLLVDASYQARSPAPFNLLDPRSRPALPALYLRLMLAAEILFPFLVLELVERTRDGRPVVTRGANALLRAATDRLLASIGQPGGPDDVLAVREVYLFRKSIADGKESTAENYLRPRLEILVDLGLVGRRPGRSDFPWIVLPQTERLASQWVSLRSRSDVDGHLDRSYFATLATVHDLSCRPVRDRDEVLLWFARAVRRVGRDIGFTPGHAGALLACLLAWEAGAILEVGDVYRAVYDAAGSEWASYLHFSGGSRLDREFLIRIDDGLVPALENHVAGNVGGAS